MIRTLRQGWSGDRRRRRDEDALYLGLKTSSHFAQKKGARLLAEFVSEVVYLFLELVCVLKNLLPLKNIYFAMLGMGVHERQILFY